MPPNEQQNYMAGQNRGLTIYKKKGGAYFYYWHKSQTCKTCFSLKLQYLSVVFTNTAFKVYLEFIKITVWRKFEEILKITTARAKPMDLIKVWEKDHMFGEFLKK